MGGVQVSVMLVFLFIQLCHGKSTHLIRCSEIEEKALFDFRYGLKDPDNRLSSWVHEGDCCQWEGVGCNNQTGHVERLDLRNPVLFVSDYFGIPFLHRISRGLGGKISPSLLNLTHLKSLDLSWNDFGGIRIPSFMGSFKELRYLNLSGAGFGGLVPSQLGNLSSLHHLDLSSLHHLDLFSSVFTSGVEVDDVQWISHLTSLQQLRMNFVNFSGKAPNNLIQALNMLPSLVEISLRGCDLGSIPLSLAHVNFTSLSFLDLSDNFFNPTIPDWLFNLSRLEHLDLQENMFYGPIPTALGTLTALEFLDLSYNYGLDHVGERVEPIGNLCKLRTLRLYGVNISINFDGLRQALSGCMSHSLEDLRLSGTGLKGDLPDWIGELNKLREIALSGNAISGHIPASLGNLRNLQYLDLSYNKLNGSVPESLGQLANLIYLIFGENNLEGALTDTHFANLKELKYLDISYNAFLSMNVSADWNPPFHLQHIVLGSCQLGPRFPAWLRKMENYTYLDISNAGISDTIPDWFWNLSAQVSTLDLANNNISGRMQCLTSQVRWMDLSNNSFSGPIPHRTGDVQYLFLSMNRINGSIPTSLCKAESLSLLDVSNNILSGEVPNCWGNYSSLQYLEISKNNLHGEIPSTICSIPYFEGLRLNNNNLTGELPSSLKNCTAIEVLDLAYNKLEGSLPTWLGESLQSLEFLLLGSNLFSGNIPPQLSRMDKLQVLDLSNNNLAGAIPSSFGNFSSMKKIIRGGMDFDDNENFQINMKGRGFSYEPELFSLLQSIDISNNGLSGNIPNEIGMLAGLTSLNLSGNQLSGGITEKIGELEQLESLDLSRNKLSGTIPMSLSNLYFLSSLNLSYNDLSGRIPTGHQLQTLDDPSIYVGNDHLCGFPTSRKCQGDDTTTEEGGSQDVEDDHENEAIWFYDGVIAGFAVGFWTVFGSLVLKRKWRITFFRFLDNMCCWQ